MATMFQWQQSADGIKSSNGNQKISRGLDSYVRCACFYCNLNFFWDTETAKSESQKHCKFLAFGLKIFLDSLLTLSTQEKNQITLEKIVLTVCQNNYGNKMPLL